MKIVKTPEPPYYAVIFTTIRTGNEEEEYQELNSELISLAENIEGYLGIESSAGLSVSYWSSLQSIGEWKNNTRHLYAQKKGYSSFYESFKTRVCLVERDNEFNIE